MSRLEQKYGTNYTVKEVAVFLNVSSMAVYKWCNKGHIGTKVEGTWRIFDKDVQKLLEQPEFTKFDMPKGRKKNINNLLKKSQSIT